MPELLNISKAVSSLKHEQKENGIKIPPENHNPEPSTSSKTSSDTVLTDNDNQPLAVKKGFLNETYSDANGKSKTKTIYDHDVGSTQHTVSDDQKKKWAEHDLNENMTKKQGMGPYSSDHTKPGWFNKDWPSNCQYNNPGCDVGKMNMSKHETELHSSMVRDNDRWKKLMAQENSGQQSDSSGVVTSEYALSFMSIKDEDITILVEKCKGRDEIELLDLSFNQICDKGVQSLAGCIGCNKENFKNLKELRIYRNEFTTLGEQMLKGLEMMRKNLKVQYKEPEYFKKKKDNVSESKGKEESDDDIKT